MNILIPHKFSGRVKLSAIKLDGSQRSLTPWFHNLVLDTGLDLIGTSSNWLDCCHVGSSGTPEANNQTSLLTPVAATKNRTAATNATSVAGGLYYGISTITYQFGVGAINGQIKELGFGPSLTLGSTLFNRARITDVLGNPSFTVVNPDEALQVVYEIKLSAPTTDITGTVNFDGTPVGYTARPALLSSSNYWSPFRSTAFGTDGQAVKATFSNLSDAHVQIFDGVLGNVIGSPSGNVSNVVYSRPQAYVPGSYQSIVRAEWDIFNGNFVSGISSILWYMNLPTGNGGNSLGAYQLQFDTPIPKSNIESFRIDLGISWGRATP